MSWAGSTSSVTRKPTAGTMSGANSSMSSTGSMSSAASASHLTSGAGGIGMNSSSARDDTGPVRTTDQASGDLIVPLVIWSDPPRVQVACLHVLYLPMSPPSHNASDLMNRWPSLASVVQQWSSQQHLTGGPGNNSTHSMVNLRRVLSRQKSRRASLRPAAAEPVNGNGTTEFVDDDDFQYVDDGDLDGDDELYQLCVFAGTRDGHIVYWLFEVDVVVQVSMLVHPTVASATSDYQDELDHGGSSQPPTASPVVGIASGIDEWGQSNMISVSQDGAIARWELPTGACSRADVCLARQLAPVKGLEMFCNNRYAIVYGEQSRMMVLDTWKLVLLYCVDTAQEQVRRGIAVVELKMPNARKTVSTSLAGTESFSRRVSDSSTTDPSEVAIATGSSFVGISGYAPSSSQASSSSFGTGYSSSTVTGRPRSMSTHIWDSLVLSLGSEGLIKCFLWSKPRGGSSSATSVGNGAASSSYQWIQESCWVISWADGADDITCSQSTSLKDGDNMNPQTALMRSIKSSYFPRCLHVSGDASLLLVIWETKWVILKRKWLCDVSPPGPTGEVRGSTGRSASWKSVTTTPKKTGSGKNVGSCRVHPAAFVDRHRGGQSETAATSRETRQVWWEDGAFLDDKQVVLWTNTGHVFQFSIRGTSSSTPAAGKLFMFTKDQDQLVPRSFHKSLNAVHDGEFVAFVHQCECCQGRYKDDAVNTGVRLEYGRFTAHEAMDTHGFTSCVFAAEGGSASRSLLATSTGGVKLVHTCQRGSVGSWNLSPGISANGSRPPSPSRRNGMESTIPVSNYEHVRMHSISDGFTSDHDVSRLSSPRESASKNEERHGSVTHLILGREGARSSSSFTESQSIMQRRRRKRPAKCGDASSISPSPGSHSALLASSMIANALSPVSAFLPSFQGRNRRASIGGGAVSNDDVYSDFLLDVPVAAHGCADGSLEFMLLASAPATNSVNSPRADRAKVESHRANVRAIAHCFWPSGQPLTDSSSNGPPAFARATTTGSAPDGMSKPGVYMSARKAFVSKRGAPMEDACLTSERNPFYRARFPPPAQRRSSSSRHLNIHQSVHSSTPSAVPPPPTSAKLPLVDDPSSAASLNFVVFSGCSDGVLSISELNLQSAEQSSFALEATPLQRFRKHRGAIQEILISPWTRENSVCPERYVATIGEDHTINVYAPVYLKNPYSHGAATAASSSRIGIEWECVMEFCEHPDAIRSVEWRTERGQLLVDCEDRMVYVWNLDTGVLERAIPSAIVYDGGNAATDDEAASPGDDDSSVECSKLAMGDTSLHLIKFNVNKSAEVIKTNWKAYYFSQQGGEGDTSSSWRENGDRDHLPKQTLPFSSPYAVGSMELLLLAFLLSWGASPEIDRACRHLLGLDVPHPLFSCVLLDNASGALSIPLPWKSVFSPLNSTKEHGADRNPFARKWQHSSALSANIALGIVSLCMSLMEHKYTKGMSTDDDDAMSTTLSSPKNKEEFHVLWSQLITQHSVVLPDYVPFFREPSLEYLANYGFHACEYTQLAARALMSSAIKRLHPPTRSALCAEYSAKLHCEIVRVETETGAKLNGTSSSSSNVVDTSLTVRRLGSLVILLSMIGTCFPGEISPSSAREVCDILVSLLRSPVQHVASVAAELLTKGLMLFRPHLVDLSSLVTQLLFIDLREKQRTPNGGDSPTTTSTFGSNARVLASGGSNAALSLLIELGACETAFVLTLLQHEMNNADRPHAFRECILLYLTELINNHYLLLFRHLPSVIDTIMHCLDPTKPERRKRCLEMSTRCLHNLVRRFPMVDFHKDTQRLAIGTMEAVILIYDLRTATKWRVLDGHASAISAVAFRSDGQILVSYAAREGSVRWWNSGNAGLFGGMLKLQQSCIKEHKLNVLKAFASAPSSSGGASGDLKQVIQTCRFQFLVLKEGPTNNNNNQQQGAGNTAITERKVLRLTREDASQVQFLM